MSFKCGIVGLPNVGKSTLFNALTNSSKAQAANFPFCTIDPNVGVVPVPDERIDELVKVSNSKKKINTTISFVDIAGLVKGASKGEGLGNKFLSHIREVDAIIHMIRCFDSNDIQNVNPNVDPIRDLEIIETEMMLADLESIQKRLEKNNKKNLDDDQLKILEIALECINNDKDIQILNEKFEKTDPEAKNLIKYYQEISDNSGPMIPLKLSEDSFDNKLTNSLGVLQTWAYLSRDAFRMQIEEIIGEPLHWAYRS